MSACHICMKEKKEQNLWMELQDDLHKHKNRVWHLQAFCVLFVLLLWFSSLVTSFQWRTPTYINVLPPIKNSVLTSSLEYKRNRSTARVAEHTECLSWPVLYVCALGTDAASLKADGAFHSVLVAVCRVMACALTDSRRIKCKLQKTAGSECKCCIRYKYGTMSNSSKKMRHTVCNLG